MVTTAMQLRCDRRVTSLRLAFDAWKFHDGRVELYPRRVAVPPGSHY